MLVAAVRRNSNITMYQNLVIVFMVNLFYYNGNVSTWRVPYCNRSLSSVRCVPTKNMSKIASIVGGRPEHEMEDQSNSFFECNVCEYIHWGKCTTPYNAVYTANCSHGVSNIY